MIVDDHAGTREMIRKFLILPGFTFKECASGEEAVACVREFKPHWVTMDVQMPGMNGFEATREIKREHPAACVIIVTAYNEPHLHDLAHSAGAVGSILKENILALRLMLDGNAKMKPIPSAAGNFEQPAQ